MNRLLPEDPDYLPLINQDTARSPQMAIVYFLMVIAISGIPLIVPSEIGQLISIILILAIIAMIGHLKGTGFGEIGLTRPDSWVKTISLGIGYAIVIFLIFRITLEPLLELITGSERDLSRFSYLKGNLRELLNLIVILWITAGFLEEVLFRGFLITNIASMFKNQPIGWAIAVVVSSLIFALAHGYQGISGMLLTGSAGAFFCFIFLYHGKNLWIPIVAHGVTDTSGALFIYFDIYDEVTSILF